MGRMFFFITFILWFGDSPAQPIKKIMIGLSFSPEYSYRFLSGNSEYAWLRDLRNELEIPKFGYTFGFHFSWRIKKKLFFEAAACFSNKGEQTKKAELIYDDPDPEAPVKLFKRYTYGFLEIPVKLEYQFSDSVSIFSFLGLALDMPTLEKVKTFYIYDNGNETHDSYYTTHTNSVIGVSAVAGIGYFIDLGKRFHLKVEPFFKCSVTPAVRQHVNEYFYSFGLNTGLFLSQ